jgi:hypothetical protein
MALAAASTSTLGKFRLISPDAGPDLIVVRGGSGAVPPRMVVDVSRESWVGSGLVSVGADTIAFGDATGAKGDGFGVQAVANAQQATEVISVLMRRGMIGLTGRFPLMSLLEYQPALIRFAQPPPVE